MRLTILGSGSPRPDPQRSQPAALLEIGGEHVLVDCGDGTMRRLVEAGVDAASVTRVVLTHLHWDHVLGLPAFAWGSWGLGRPRLEVWGPAGTAELLRTTLQAPFAEQAAWVATLGWDAAGWDDVVVHEIGDGATVDVGGGRLRFGRVHHPPIEAYGVRAEHDGAVVTISGDTTACEELVALARDADLLLMDACAPASDHPLAGFHATPGDAGDVAARAGAGRLLLPHLLPGVDPEQVTGQACGRFAGRVEVARDLDAHDIP
jgi:ribonuclease BN (tRNA processing enzyme)